ncbi:hypothetical protein OH492_24120 [Vibrio chagasii]|nr:hypothetical protein [Vibrio chagasii]
MFRSVLASNWFPNSTADSASTLLWLFISRVKCWLVFAASLIAADLRGIFYHRNSSVVFARKLRHI